MQAKGPPIKYVTLFLANFDPLPPLSHFVTHPETPESTSHISDIPPNFNRPSTKTRTKAHCTNSVSIVRGEFCPEVLSEGLLFRNFCPGWFLSVPLLSENICYNRKLNITLNFMFHMYDTNFYKCDARCSVPPLPLSQTVTSSRTPSLERDVHYGRPLSLQHCTHSRTIEVGYHEHKNKPTIKKKAIGPIGPYTKISSCTIMLNVTNPVNSQKFKEFDMKIYKF